MADQRREPESELVTIVLEHGGKHTVELVFPEDLRGKDLWYFVKNQHGGTDFCGAFSIPETGGALSLIVSGGDRSVTALANRKSKEDSFFDRAQDFESYPFFAIRAASRCKTDYRDFAVFFANSETSLNAALNGEFISYPKLGEDRFVEITLKRPNEVIPDAAPQTAQPTLPSPIPLRVD